MSDGIEIETRWLVRDAAADAQVAAVAIARVPHGRPTTQFVAPRAAASGVGNDVALSAALLVPAERFETLEFVEERVERRAGTRAAETVPPPRKFGAVSSSWISAAGSLSARDLLDTLRVVESRRVDPQDLPSVVEIFAEVTGRQPRMR